MQWPVVERPIRHFEIVSEVINSWDKDKSVNLLVAKKTSLATLLNLSVRLIPSYSWFKVTKLPL